MSIFSSPLVTRPAAFLLQRMKPEPLEHLVFADIPADKRTLMIPTLFGAAECTVFYPPELQGGAPPVHVNFHGGGFVIGYPPQDDPQCRYVAAHGGIVVVNVDYVLAPKHPFPAAVHQAFEIVGWIADHGVDHGWDGSRLSVGGQSAGGSIAAAVARQARDAGGPRIGLQFLHYPPLDLMTSSYDKRSKIDKPLISPRLAEILDTLYLPREADRSRPLASPAYGSNADDLAGIAPAFVVTAEFDLLRDEAVLYAEKLRHAGALLDHKDLMGVDHGYNLLGKDVELSKRYTEEVVCCGSVVSVEANAKLYRRWGTAPRSRPAGAGFKPPQAAGVKSPRGERCGKRRKRFRQVRLKETSESEPLMTCRNVFYRRRNRDLDLYPASKGWGKPADCPTGVRHEGGVTLRQASIRNTGTCRPDAKGEAQAVSRREGQSTEAGHRGGDARSRDEGPVMGLDRRGVVIRLYPAGNPQGDDPHG